MARHTLQAHPGETDERVSVVQWDEPPLRRSHAASAPCKGSVRSPALSAVTFTAAQKPRRPHRLLCPTSASCKALTLLAVSAQTRRERDGLPCRWLRPPCGSLLLQLRILRQQHRVSTKLCEWLVRIPTSPFSLLLAARMINTKWESQCRRGNTRR